MDDHTVVREGLKQILRRLPDCEEVGEAGDGAQALRKVREHEWDLVLLDVGLPGGNGLEALKRIKEEKPRLPVLILSMFPEDQYALRVLRAGASGYLTKESAPDQLLSAVREALAGRKYISPASGPSSRCRSMPRTAGVRTRRSRTASWRSCSLSRAALPWAKSRRRYI